MNIDSPRPLEFHSMGLKLQAYQWGNPTNPLLVAHHGFLDHGLSWRWVAEAIKNNWSVVALDARGHGDSDWVGAGGDYAFGPYLADLDALLRHLGNRPVVLMGHSMGASVVAYYAGVHPKNVRGVITLEGLGPQDHPVQDTPTHLEKYIRHMDYGFRHRTIAPFASVDEAANRLIRTDPLLSKERALQLAKTSTHVRSDGVRWKFDPLHRAPMATPFSVDRAIPIWRKITAPMLNIRGAVSPYMSNDHQARLGAIKHIREVVIPDASHNLHTHADRQVTAAITPFLKTLGE
jgi:pimeloyl-ACP methyl ester carboxylesterase